MKKFLSILFYSFAFSFFVTFILYATYRLLQWISDGLLYFYKVYEITAEAQSAIGILFIVFMAIFFVVFIILLEDRYG